MGLLGPKRTVVEDVTSDSSGPFARLNNEYSVPDWADLVGVDPVGAAVWRPVGDAEGLAGLESFTGIGAAIGTVPTCAWTSRARF